jgi:hypothetical protein
LLAASKERLRFTGLNNAIEEQRHTDIARGRDEDCCVAIYHKAAANED